MLARPTKGVTQPLGLVIVIHINGTIDVASKLPVVERLVDDVKKQFTNIDADRRFLVFGDLLIDRELQEVTRGSRPVHLEPMEYSLLECLVLNHDRVVSKSHLNSTVFKNSNFRNSKAKPFNLLCVCVNQLRKKIDRGRSARLIHTRRGFGYYLRTPSG